MIQAFLFVIGSLAGAQPGEMPKIQTERNAQLEFMVGEWTTVHEVPTRDATSTTFPGQASIDRALGGTFVRHEWSGKMEGRPEFFMMLMMNYSPDKQAYNCCLFDRSGGEPGMFYGDWTDDNTLELKATFVEQDGSMSHQRFTFVKLNKASFKLSRAFSDDGENYHFDITGTYTRNTEPDPARG